jgi:hypothetical protein
VKAYLRAVRPGGEIACIGFLNAKGPGIDFFALFASGATFRHIAVGSREGLQDVARTIARARIKPVIDRVFDFEDAKDAFAHLESGSHFWEGGHPVFLVHPNVFDRDFPFVNFSVRTRGRAGLRLLYSGFGTKCGVPHFVPFAPQTHRV